MCTADIKRSCTSSRRVLQSRLVRAAWGGYGCTVGWVVIAGGGRRRSIVYTSEDEAEQAARELANTLDEDTWVAIADEDANTTRIIKLGDDD